MGIELDSKLAQYARLLAGWPGLIAKGADAAALVADSLALLPHLEGVARLVDVGSGGGMPGLPLKLARPDLQVTLIESDRRKAAFLAHAAAVLALAVEVRAERAEETGQGPLRETFDAACSRALAPLPVAAELCLPLVRVGGRLLAMRTGGDAGEAENETELAAAAAQLGGGAPLVHRAPSAARQRGTILVVGKLAPTPERYPRRPGLPNRRPLGR
jgi:16S rRNA (guanine527-N7)-methyltransferase